MGCAQTKQRSTSAEILKAAMKEEGVAALFAMRGFKPGAPVLLVPGFMGSLLKVEKCTAVPEWEGCHLWTNLLTGCEADTEKREKWVHLFSCNPDGSDPPDAVVRPVEGLEGLNFHDPSVKTQVMPIVNVLKKIGYGTANLAAATYDWRQAPKILEQRDQFFTRMQATVESLYEQNSKKAVVFVAHSMGCKIVHYFLHWIKWNPLGYEWVQEHIHSFFAISGPFLGSPRPLSHA